MRVWLLSSGSSGNALVVEHAGERLLVDAGIGPRVAATRMRLLGAEDLFPGGVTGIVVTHQHGDHISRLEPLVRALRAPIYLHPGVSAQRIRNRYDVRPYRAGIPFEVGRFTVLAETIPHDAPQVALRFSAGALSFGLATDLGHVPDNLVTMLRDCDEALVEANYCAELLRDGPYPPRLQGRVSGKLGHLDNDQTGALAASLVGSRLHRLWLGHLSKVNNTPARALGSVKAFAPALDVRVVPHGEPRLLEIAAGPRRIMKPVQLMLALG